MGYHILYFTFFLLHDYSSGPRRPNSLCTVTISGYITHFGLEFCFLLCYQ